MKNISARLTSVIDGMCDTGKADELVTNVCIHIGKLKHDELTSDQFWFLVYRELVEAIPDKDNRDAIVSQFELEILRNIGLQNDVRRLSNLQRIEDVSKGWQFWWDAVHGNRSLKKQIKLAGRQVGKTYVNAEMAKRVSLED